MKTILDLASIVILLYGIRHDWEVPFQRALRGVSQFGLILIVAVSILFGDACDAIAIDHPSPAVVLTAFVLDLPVLFLAVGAITVDGLPWRTHRITLPTPVLAGNVGSAAVSTDRPRGLWQRIVDWMNGTVHRRTAVRIVGSEAVAALVLLRLGFNGPAAAHLFWATVFTAVGIALVIRRRWRAR